MKTYASWKKARVQQIEGVLRTTVFVLSLFLMGPGRAFLTLGQFIGR